MFQTDASLAMASIRNDPSSIISTPIIGLTG
jgi:hypothetical protein